MAFEADENLALRPLVLDTVLLPTAPEILGELLNVSELLAS